MENSIGDKLIISLICTFIFVAYRAKYDYKKISKKEKIYHGFNAACSIFFGSLISYIGFKSLYFLPIHLSVYWILFDMLLNDMRHKNLLYIGTTAFLDKLFDSAYIMLFVKIICILISFAIFFYFKN